LDKSLAQAELERKIAVSTEIALTAFSMFDADDLDKLLALLRERRKLKAKALFAAANSKTGATAAKAHQELKANTEKIVNLQPDWLN
jgi:hypothetical protein